MDLNRGALLTRRLSLLELEGIGGIVEDILKYVAAGNEGLHDLLTLRQVCVDTKRWVEYLPKREIAKVLPRELPKTVTLELKYFDRSDMEANESGRLLWTSELKEFLENPEAGNEAAKLLSLRYDIELLGNISSMELDFPDLHRKEDEIWRKFVGHWWPKLEHLEVSYYHNFLDNFLNSKHSLVNDLLSSRTLRSIRCEEIHDFSEEEIIPIEFFPLRFFELEHISIGNLWLPSKSDAYKKFFWLLGENSNLKSFEYGGIWEIVSVEELSKFIRRTKDKPELRMKLTFDLDFLFFEDELEGKLDSFCLAVAESSASIRIYEFPGGELEELKQTIGEEKAGTFLSCVEGVDYLPLELLKELPNLKELGGLENTNDEKYEQYVFPEKLHRLEVRTGFPRNLPGSLKRLTLSSVTCSVGELMNMLESLDKSCPYLDHFKLTWTCKDSSLEMCLLDGDAQQIEEKACGHKKVCVCGVACGPKVVTRFESLRSLSFNVQVTSPTKSTSDAGISTPRNLHGAVWILVYSFGLRTSSLVHLFVDYSGDLGEYDNSAGFQLDRKMLLTSLLDGEARKTLVKLDLGRWTGPPNDPLVAILKSDVDDNSKESRLGSAKFY